MPLFETGQNLALMLSSFVEENMKEENTYVFGQSLALFQTTSDGIHHFTEMKKKKKKKKKQTKRFQQWRIFIWWPIYQLKTSLSFGINIYLLIFLFFLHFILSSERLLVKSENEFSILSSERKSAKIESNIICTYYS